MAKIMLVEDDNNLREIYEARLLAEGYEIVSAEDGEQALALAVKEKPDLIISDVMMPKISGFDMLDILRSTPETKNTKVIMMTALSQAEDKTRADKLGADRYLVKSQVTLEDVAKVAREVLAGEGESPAGGPLSSGPASDPVAVLPAEPVTVTPATPPPDDNQKDDTSGGTPDPKVEPEQTNAPGSSTTTTPSASPAAVAITPAAEPVAPVVPVASPPAPERSATPPVERVPVESISSRPVTPTTPPIDPNLGIAATQEEANVASQINKFAESLPGQEKPLPPPPQMEMVEVPGASTDLTNAAADNAAKMANAANELLGKTDTQPTPAPAAQAPEPVAPKLASNQIAGKRILMPINDVHSEQAKPSLNELLEKEAANNAVNPLPTTSVVSPTGEAVTPPAPGQSPNDKGPGNVIQPGDPDPNSIAL
jgi:CheY-like chemotaxis protein